MIDINKSTYLTEKELLQAIKILPNAQDKFFVLALYYGLSGNNYSILSNLKKEDISFETNTICSGGVTVKMNEEFAKIAKECIEQKTYTVLFANDRTVSEYDIPQSTEYMINAKPSAKNNGLKPMSVYGLRTRFNTIKEFMRLPNITISSLHSSYIVEQLLKEKSEWKESEVIIKLAAMKENSSAFRIFTLIKKLKDSFN